jgi:hypothetical protein
MNLPPKGAKVHSVRKFINFDALSRKPAYYYFLLALPNLTTLAAQTRQAHKQVCGKIAAGY